MSADVTVFVFEEGTTGPVRRHIFVGLRERPALMVWPAGAFMKAPEMLEKVCKT